MRRDLEKHLVEGLAAAYDDGDTITVAYTLSLAAEHYGEARADRIWSEAYRIHIARVEEARRRRRPWWKRIWSKGFRPDHHRPGGSWR